jgi:hypothetical protein
MRLARIITITTLALAPASASVITTDNTFIPTDWSGVQSVQTIGLPSAASASTIPLGGLAGPFRQLGLFRQIDLPSNRTIADIRPIGTHDPGSQGPLVGLGYYADFMVQASAGMTGTWGFALRQNGTVYLNNTLFTIAPAWTPTTIVNQSATDFLNPVSSTNPDFTASGSLMEFGFFLRGVSFGLSSAGFNLGMDNLCVWDHNSGNTCGGATTPEPGTMALVGILLIALVTARGYLPTRGNSGGAPR